MITINKHRSKLKNMSVEMSSTPHSNLGIHWKKRYCE